MNVTYDEMAADLLIKAGEIIRKSAGDEESVGRALAMVGAALGLATELYGEMPTVTGEPLMVVTPENRALYVVLKAECDGETPGVTFLPEAAYGLDAYNEMRRV